MFLVKTYKAFLIAVLFLRFLVVVMDKLAIVQLANELFGEMSDQALCEEENDILPFVLAISFYRRKELPRIDGYMDLINNHYLADDFRQHFRVRPSTFERFMSFWLEWRSSVFMTVDVADLLLLSRCNSCFLWYLARQETYVSSANRFGKGEEEGTQYNSSKDNLGAHSSSVCGHMKGRCGTLR